MKTNPLALLLAAFTFFSCGGSETPAPDDSAGGGSGGSSGTAGSAGSVGGDLPPGMVVATMGPNGPECPNGMEVAPIKADEQQALCRVQATTTPPDATPVAEDSDAPTPVDASVSGPPDLSPPDPDGPTSPDASTTWTPAEGMQVYCGVHTDPCTLHEVSPGMWYCPGVGIVEDGWSTQDIQQECSPTPR